MAGLARSAADQEVQRSLRDADRALRRAADVCRRVISEGKNAGKERFEFRRVINTQKDIEYILGRIAGLGRIDPLGQDLNVVSETERDRMLQEDYKKKREASRKSRKVD